MDQPGFTQTRSTLAMTCAGEVDIRSAAEITWSLLTDANAFPRWNSTVMSVEDEFREGEHLKARVPGTRRSFTPLVSGVVPNERMTCSDGVAARFNGVRRFVLTACDDDSTDFTMSDTFPRGEQNCL